MAEKTLNTRIVQKHDTQENWEKALNFIPKVGEIIVYDVDAAYPYERFKIGDGVTTINNLPFTVPEGAIDEEIIDVMLELDMLPTIIDADGSVLVDSDETIVLF